MKIKKTKDRALSKINRKAHTIKAPVHDEKSTEQYRNRCDIIDDANGFNNLVRTIESCFEELHSRAAELEWDGLIGNKAVVSLLESNKKTVEMLLRYKAAISERIKSLYISSGKQEETDDRPEH